MLNSCAVASEECDNCDLKNFHLVATCAKAVVGAVLANSQYLANSVDIVAGVTRQFGIFFPVPGAEETAMRGCLDQLRSMDVLQWVGAAPEKGFFHSGNAWICFGVWRLRRCYRRPVVLWKLCLCVVMRMEWKDAFRCCWCVCSNQRDHLQRRVC